MLLTRLVSRGENFKLESVRKKSAPCLPQSQESWLPTEWLVQILPALL